MFIFYSSENLFGLRVEKYSVKQLLIQVNLQSAF